MFVEITRVDGTIDLDVISGRKGDTGPAGPRGPSGPGADVTAAEIEAARDAAAEAAALAEQAAAAAAAGGTTTDEVMAARIADPESATARELSATVARSALPVVVPPLDDLAYLFDFSERPDTAGGALGAADKGGAPAITGAAAASAHIEDGYFTTDGGVAYAVWRLPVRPDVVVVRNRWTGTSGPTVGILADQVAFSINTWNGIHAQTSKNTINAFLAVPATEGGPTKVPDIMPATPALLGLVDGVDYDTRVDLSDVDLGYYSVTVTRASDGRIMGTGTFYDASIAARLPAGPTQLMLEPDQFSGYSYAVAYQVRTAEVAAPAIFPGGVSGPVGVKSRDVGRFRRVHIGAAGESSALLHIVSDSAAGVPIIESTHPGGAGMRLKSGAGAVATVYLQPSGATDANAAFVRATTAAQVVIGTTVAGTEANLLTLNRNTGALTLSAPASNAGRLDLVGNGTGYGAELRLQASGGTAARIKQQWSANDFRVEVNGTDRLIISNSGAFNITGTLDHDGTSVGFYGTAPVARPTVPAAATDAATTQALVNSLRSLLVGNGLAASA